RAAFEAAAFALGRFFLDHRARIKDVEINPLMVRANNQSPAHDPQSKVQKPAGADPSVVAVDVRVLWRGGGGGVEREKGFACRRGLRGRATTHSPRRGIE